MPRHPKSGRCIYAASSQSADLCHATGFEVPDPVLYFQFKRKSYLLLSPLELERGRKSARVDQVVSLEILSAELGKKKKEACPILIEDIAILFCRKHGIESLEVPPEFPLSMADALRSGNISVTVKSPFYPERRKKSELQIEHIMKGQRQAEQGLHRGLEVLSLATIRKNRTLEWGGRTLTSERLRFEIENAVRLAGGVPEHTIVAGGVQACDPHEVGHGPLRAEETIILDIFPYDRKTHYYGDLTRTIVKGRATEAQRKLYKTVKTGQQAAMKVIKAGIDGNKLQNRVKDEFTKQGYPTEVRHGQWVGFFHGLGHGLGLEIHEAPRIASGKLRTGDVITVEPGLYYPDVGGIRLENVVVVKPDGNRNLTKSAYRFEIP